MKKIIVLTVAAIYFAAASSLLAQTTSVTATITANPLRVTVSTPSSVSVGQWFNIEAQISNLGIESIKQAHATIGAPSELQVTGKKRGIAKLDSGKTKTVYWRARAKSPGTFIIQVEATGVITGEQIFMSDTSTIEIEDSLSAFLLRLILVGEKEFRNFRV